MQVQHDVLKIVCQKLSEAGVCAEAPTSTGKGFNKEKIDKLLDERYDRNQQLKPLTRVMKEEQDKYNT